MKRGPAKSRLWIWVTAACLLHVAAWTLWIVVASHHPVEEVPLATAPR
jgi:hypothetical protein